MSRNTLNRSVISTMILATAFLAWPAAPRAVITYPDPENFVGVAKHAPFNGHWYVVGRYLGDWEACKDWAENTIMASGLRGHLATITSEEENQFVAGVEHSGAPEGVLWIGAYQRPGAAKNEGWYWITGEPWQYTRWANGEPNDSHGGEDAVDFRPWSLEWNDSPHAFDGVPVVEFEVIEDHPSTTVYRPGGSYHVYQIALPLLHWDAAEAAAATAEFWGFPGHLATLASASEDAWVVTQLDFTLTPVVWLGADRPSPEAGWQWTTGEPWQYTRWATGEPDITSSTPVSLALRTEGETGWIDANPRMGLPSLIEYDVRPPQPGENAVMGLDGRFLQAEVADSTGFAIPGDFTVELWARPDLRGGSVQTLVSNSQYYELGARGFQLFLYDAGVAGFRVVFSVGGKGQVTSTTTLPLREWHHVAGVLQGNQLRLYLDGRRDAALEGADTPIVNSGRAMFVGINEREGLNTYRGLMDEIRLWNRAKDDVEMADNFQATMDSHPTGLLMYYPIELDDVDVIHDRASGAHPLLPIGLDPLGRNRPVLVPGALQLLTAVNITASAAITPTSPTAWDDLTCVVHVENPDGLPLAYSAEWFRNGERLDQPLVVAAQILPTTTLRLPAAYIQREDRVFCRAHIATGTREFLRTTQEVEVGNATASAPVVHIVPDDPQPWDGLGVEFLSYSVDPDGDPIGYRINWYRSQDGGQTFVLRLEVSGIAPAGNWIPPAFLHDGDIWRVEAAPFQKMAGANADGGATSAETQGPEGESGWDQVYVGTNGHPTVQLTEPQGSEAPALGRVRITWRAEDPDGDPVIVRLWYQTVDGPPGERLLATDLPASGSLSWTPPGMPANTSSPDANADGVIDFVDALRLARSWGEPTMGARFRIVARVFDTHGAMQRVESDAIVVAPDAYPSDVVGLFGLIDRWHD